MGRKKQNPEDSAKRALILEMAQKMFISQGYSEVSMDALADAVPVSKRTLYNHFKDKNALFTAVMQVRCQRLFDSLQESLKYNKDIKGVLTSFGQQFLTQVLQKDAVNMYRIIAMEAHKFPELGELFYQSGPKRAVGVLANYLQELNDKHVLHVPDAELSAHFFFGMLKSRSQMQCLLGLKKTISPAEKAKIVEYAVDIFLNGHRASSGKS